MNYKFYTDKGHATHNIILNARTNIDLSYVSFKHRIEKHIKNYFENTSVYIQPVISCTSANTLAVLAALKSGEKMLCSEVAHLLKYENHAIKILGEIEVDTLPTVNGKICPESLQEKLSQGKNKEGKCYALLSITQPTELGTVYTIKELEVLYKIALEYNLFVHIDGARFFYAINYLKCTPKEILDNCHALTLGLKKFGGAGDLLILKSPTLLDRVLYLQKLFSQTVPRQHLLFQQMEVFFKKNIHRQTAQYTHNMTCCMLKILMRKKVRVLYPVQANILYIQLDSENPQTLLKNFKLAISSSHKSVVRIVLSYAINYKEMRKIAKEIISL